MALEILIKVKLAVYAVILYTFFPSRKSGGGLAGIKTLAASCPNHDLSWLCEIALKQKVVLG